MFTHEEILSLQSAKDKAESQLYDAVALLEQIQSDFIGKDWTEEIYGEPTKLELKQRERREFVKAYVVSRTTNQLKLDVEWAIQAWEYLDKQLTEIEKEEAGDEQEG